MIMNKQQKIDKIYEVIADKTLSFGCRMQWLQYNYIMLLNRKSHYDVMSDIDNPKRNMIDPTDIYKIIWHPVMIWDVLQYFFNIIPQDVWPDDFYNMQNKILDKRDWYELNKPIEDQSEECIDFIYWLVEKVETK